MTARQKPGGTARRHAGGAQQVRIIGGQWKRTPLPVLDLPGLRPTPDRVRETVFNWIHHLCGGNWSRLRCLDLFAGSGAMGFEAASRGAASVTLVELNRDAALQLERNKEKLKAGQVQVTRGDVLAVIQGLQQARARFDVIFLDPPYGHGWLSTIFPLCASLLAEDGLVYAESDQELASAEKGGKHPPLTEEAVPDWLRGWEVVRTDKAGVVTFQLLKSKETGDFQA